MKQQMSAEARLALQQAAEWRLLGLLLHRPHGGWWSDIEALASEVEDAQLKQAAQSARKATESEYLAILGPGGSVSPREVAYRGMHDPGQILADIAAFHRAFGFAPRGEDPIDHVAVAAGFIGYLHLKVAYAQSHGNREAAQTAALAAERYLELHLCAYAAPLAERLVGSSLQYASMAAELLAARAGQPPESSQAESDPSELTCGACDDLLRV
jgi:hypothetical protein